MDPISIQGVCPHGWSHVDPTVRLGLERPTALRLKMMIGASRAYHGIKFSHRPVVEEAIASGNFDSVRRINQVLAAQSRQELGIT